jgi:hypothetical protein
MAALSAGVATLAIRTRELPVAPPEVPRAVEARAG